MDANIARSIRNKRRNELDQFGTNYDDEADDQFHKNPMNTIKVSEEEMEVQKIKRQLEYYGNKLEPLHMKNERDSGQMDKEGFFNFDRMKEAKQDDAWLQALDEEGNIDQKDLKRKIRGLFDDVDQSDQEEQQQKKVKFTDDVQFNEKMPAELTRKEKLAKLPFIALKKRILGYLQEEESVNKALIRFKLDFPVLEEKKKPFKKNVRKQDIEKQKLAMEEENQVTDEKLGQQNLAKDYFEQLVELSDLILVATGKADIFTLSKPELEKQIEKDIEEQKVLDLQRAQQMQKEQQERQLRISKDEPSEDESHYSSDDSQMGEDDEEAVNLTSDEEGNKKEDSDNSPEQLHGIPKKDYRDIKDTSQIIQEKMEIQKKEEILSQLVQHSKKDKEKEQMITAQKLAKKVKETIEQQPDEDDIF